MGGQFFKALIIDHIANEKIANIWAFQYFNAKNVQSTEIPIPKWTITASQSYFRCNGKKTYNR